MGRDRESLSQARHRFGQKAASANLDPAATCCVVSANGMALYEKNLARTDDWTYG